VVFVANGLGGPSFLARLPERQSDLGLSDLGLGMALVGMAVGALVASPVAGRLVSTHGSRLVVVASGLALGTSLWTVGAAPHVGLFFGALVAVGAADAAMDISMNANGAAYEGPYGRSLMHRLHGAWSLGALSAAGLAAVLLATGIPLTVHLVGIGVLIAGSTVVARRSLPVPSGAGASPVGTSPAGPIGPAGVDGELLDPEPGTPSGAPVVPPELAPRASGAGRFGPLLVLGAATVAGAVIEGGPADWSAIQLERFGVATGVSALGYAAFMAGMLGGRLVGDRLTDAYGGAQVLRVGMVVGALGLASGVAVGHPLAFAAGLVLAGAGASGFFPLAFAAASRTPGVAPGAGAATVSLAARVGFLAEPVLMGGIAEAVGLRWAFATVAVLALVVAASATRIVPPAARPGPAPIADLRAP
jgi:hypothetical protein